MGHDSRNMKPRATTSRRARSRGVDRAAAELRAVNERQAREGLERLRTDLLALERYNGTADDAFREVGTWDGDNDPVALNALLRAARDAGGSKPPVKF
jgi:hypothetical protein